MFPKSIFVDIGCTWKLIIYDIRDAQEFVGHAEVIHVYLYSQFCINEIPVV